MVPKLANGPHLSDFALNLLITQNLPGTLNKVPVSTQTRLGHCPPQFAVFKDDISNDGNEKVRWPLLSCQQYGLSVRHGLQGFGPPGTELT